MKIVQLGACWGNDHVTELVKRHTEIIEFLLLVEPNPALQEKLKECYAFFPKTNVEQIAIVPNYNNGTELDMFFTKLDEHYQLTSLIKNHIIKHNYHTDSIETFRTKSSTLADLFNKYSVYNLDYLFIDIEGVDEQVLLSLDLNKYNIKNICIEILHLSEPDKLYKFLENNGYKDTGEVYNLYDKMFVKAG